MDTMTWNDSHMASGRFHSICKSLFPKHMPHK
jgi:hypothetical protein